VSDPNKKAVEKDARRAGQRMRALGIPTQAISFDDPSDWPDGDGDGALIPVTIGLRGQSTKDEAQVTADMWRTVIARYPKAIFQIVFFGYDDDPRELWEFPDVRRYVRWWAKLAGLTDLETADRAPATDGHFAQLDGRAALPWDAEQAIVALAKLWGEPVPKVRGQISMNLRHLANAR
jgi:hypothetical protein